MFEKASRLKLRFDSDKGLLHVEDLWDLPLQGLNVIAKGLNKELKSSEEEDFLEEKSAGDRIIKLKFDIVLHIIKTKKSEAEKRADASEKRARKEKLMNILEKKQDAGLEEKSEKDLIKEIKDLEDDDLIV